MSVDLQRKVDIGKYWPQYVSVLYYITDNEHLLHIIHTTNQKPLEVKRKWDTGVDTPLLQLLLKQMFEGSLRLHQCISTLSLIHI